MHADECVISNILLCLPFLELQGAISRFPGALLRALRPSWEHLLGGLLGPSPGAFWGLLGAFWGKPLTVDSQVQAALPIIISEFEGDGIDIIGITFVRRNMGRQQSIHTRVAGLMGLGRGRIWPAHNISHHPE